MALTIASGSAFPQFNNSTTTFGWVFSISEQKSVQLWASGINSVSLVQGHFLLDCGMAQEGPLLLSPPLPMLPTIVGSTWSSGQWLFTDLASPVVLDAGQYVLGAFGNFQYWRASPCRWVFGSADTLIPDVSRRSICQRPVAVVSASTWNLGSYINPAYFGPNLQFGEVSAVPLPAAFPLLASGLGGLGLIGWRRKRKTAPRAAA